MFTPLTDLCDERLDMVTTDLDSIVVVSRSCSLYGIIDKFALSTGKSCFITKCQQKKTFIILDPTESKLWYEFRLGGTGNLAISVVFSVLKKKNYNKIDSKGILSFFFEKIIKEIILPVTSRTNRMGTFKNFTLYDNRHRPNVFSEDWHEFCEGLQSALEEHRKKLSSDFGIDNVYFMRFLHGLKLSKERECPNFVRFMMDDLKVNLTSRDAVIVQVHIANTLIPKKDHAVLIKIGNLTKTLFKSSDLYTVYKKFFLHDYGAITSR